jgi:hypothetical protein
MLTLTVLVQVLLLLPPPILLMEGNTFAMVFAPPPGSLCSGHLVGTPLPQ